MSIDDPISALLALNESDERQKSPISRFTQPFLAIVKMLAPPGVEVPVDSLEVAANWLDGRAESNQQELLKVFAEEFKHLAAKIHRVRDENEEQRRFMEDDLPGLTLDALRRAEECRAKERVARLAKILTHASWTGAREGADLIEDMMAVATRLSEKDLLILRQAAIEYHAESSTHHSEAQRSVATRAWRRVPTNVECAVSQDELVSIGSKLESFGLATRVETGVPWEPPVFRPLPFGYKFIEYIRTAEQLT